MNTHSRREKAEKVGHKSTLKGHVCHSKQDLIPQHTKGL